MNVVELMCFQLVRTQKVGWFRENHAKALLALQAFGVLRFRQLLYRTGIPREELEDVLFELCKHKVVERKGFSWATPNLFEALNALLEGGEWGAEEGIVGPAKGLVPKTQQFVDCQSRVR